MIISLHLPDAKLKFPPEEVEALKDYLQKVVNRYAVGHVRYGPISRSKDYMKRLHMEVLAYIRKGNKEQLLNSSLYGFLESYSPEHPNFHFDNSVDSVTRGRV